MEQLLRAAGLGEDGEEAHVGSALRGREVAGGPLGGATRLGVRASGCKRWSGVHDRMTSTLMEGPACCPIPGSAR